MGKSAMLTQLAQELDGGVPIETVIASVREPADFLGLPVIGHDESGIQTTTYAPPDWFQRLKAAGKGILFLDEFSNAPPAVQAALLRVVNERYVGREKLPDDVIIVMAANPPETATDYWELKAPTTNRLLHLKHAPSTEDFVTGMIGGFDRLIDMHKVVDGVKHPSEEDLAAARATVAAFIRVRPELAQKTPKDAASGAKPWPSFRSWTWLSQVLAHLEENDVEARTLAAEGLVGQAGIEFLTWLQLADLPDPADVLANPKKVNWKDREDRTFAILSGVTAYVLQKGTADDWANGWKVLAAAADGGAGDICVPSAEMLMKARDSVKGARIPSEIRVFVPYLQKAGLMPDVPGGVLGS